MHKVLPLAGSTSEAAGMQWVPGKWGATAGGQGEAEERPAMNSQDDLRVVGAVSVCCLSSW